MSDLKIFFISVSLVIIFKNCVTTKKDISNKMSTYHLMKEMFEEMVVKKNSSLLEKYYHKDYKMYANGVEQSYDEYAKGHIEIYKTAIQYTIEIDPETVMETKDKAAMRVFITTSLPKKEPTEIEVILIAQFKQSKIYRLWELTRPDWTQMENFKKNYLQKK